MDDLTTIELPQDSHWRIIKYAGVDKFRRQMVEAICTLCNKVYTVPLTKLKASNKYVIRSCVKCGHKIQAQKVIAKRINRPDQEFLIKNRIQTRSYRARKNKSLKTENSELKEKICALEAEVIRLKTLLYSVIGMEP